ncbi:MAG: StlD/DarB family beta-ketosynthase [Desulfobacteraceae bacterium]|nr:MAG: StlD/DarB family beta-ketosynthase [Desulfobacteraceae bacterium]
MSVYITDVTAFLPNQPVDNDAIETVLGKVNNLPSRTKKIVLRNNQIQQRYYAIDPSTGRMTHTNAQLTAEAVRQLKPYDGFKAEEIQCLCCGTTSPDLMFPGHALMVMGELALPPLEAVTTSGICLSGMTALKFAYLNVAAGCSRNAVATGSELASSYMRSAFFKVEGDPEADLDKNPIRLFDADFLRWMLSDGAGAVYLTDRPAADRLSLRVEWIEHYAFSGELETCMYGGGAKCAGGRMAGWRQMESIPQDQQRYLYNVRQDIKILDKHIVPTMGRALAMAAAKHKLSAADVDWFLPHYSSAYFRPRFYEGMQKIGFEIPYHKWFTNLALKGNTGSAAIFIILAELVTSGKLQAGQRLLCFIPESGRFAHCFMLLQVVEPGRE